MARLAHFHKLLKQVAVAPVRGGLAGVFGGLASRQGRLLLLLLLRGLILLLTHRGSYIIGPNNARGRVEDFTNLFNDLFTDFFCETDRLKADDQRLPQREGVSRPRRSTARF